MKKSVLTIVILVAGLLVASQFITSCGDKKQATEEKTTSTWRVVTARITMKT